MRIDFTSKLPNFQDFLLRQLTIGAAGFCRSELPWQGTSTRLSP